MVFFPWDRTTQAPEAELPATGALISVEVCKSLEALRAIVMELPILDDSDKIILGEFIDCNINLTQLCRVRATVMDAASRNRDVARVAFSTVGILTTATVATGFALVLSPVIVPGMIASAVVGVSSFVYHFVKENEQKANEDLKDQVSTLNLSSKQMFTVIDKPRAEIWHRKYMKNIVEKTGSYREQKKALEIVSTTSRLAPSAAGAAHIISTGANTVKEVVMKAVHSLSGAASAVPVTALVGHGCAAVAISIDLYMLVKAGARLHRKQLCQYAATLYDLSDFLEVEAKKMVYDFVLRRWPRPDEKSNSHQPNTLSSHWWASLEMERMRIEEIVNEPIDREILPHFLLAIEAPPGWNPKEDVVDEGEDALMAEPDM